MMKSGAAYALCLVTPLASNQLHVGASYEVIRARELRYRIRCKRIRRD